MEIGRQARCILSFCGCCIQVALSWLQRAGFTGSHAYRQFCHHQCGARIFVL